MSERYVVFVLPESSAIAEMSIVGTWRTREAAERFLERFLKKRTYMSGMVVDLLTEADARELWEQRGSEADWEEG